MRIALLLLALALTGCVSRPNLCRTALAIRADLDPAQVSIANVQRKWLTSSSTWEARAPDGVYLCRGDYMFGAVACAKPRPPSAAPPSGVPLDAAPSPSAVPPSAAPPTADAGAPGGSCG